MDNKQKLKYIALGAVIMLIGMGVGSTLTTPLVAQHNGVFDTITCREIKVVDKTGKRIAFLGRQVGDVLGIPYADNAFIIYGRDEDEAIHLSCDEESNLFSVNKPGGKNGFNVLTGKTLTGCRSSNL